LHDDYTSVQPPLADSAYENRPRQPLGIGGLITDSFAIFFRHVVIICLIGLVPMLLGQVFPALILGAATGFADVQTNPFGAATFAVPLGMGFLLLVVYILTTAMVIQLAYDEQLGRRIRVGSYIRPTLRALPAILILSVAIALILFISQVVLSLLGSATPYLLVVGIPLEIGFFLWILAVFSVCAPAVIFEKAGLRGLARSARLTREYRWPIVGTLVLTSLLVLVFYLVVGGVIMVFSMVTGGLIGALFFGLLSTAGTSILVITVTLIYTRLRDIKEGIGLDQVATVFD
jgi:hypothetical protein